MSDYIFLMRGGSERTRSLDEAQMQDYMNQWKDYMGKLAGAGGLAGGAPLGAEARMIEGEAKSVSAIEHSGNLNLLFPRLTRGQVEHSRCGGSRDLTQKIIRRFCCDKQKR